MSMTKEGEAGRFRNNMIMLATVLKSQNRNILATSLLQLAGYNSGINEGKVFVLF